MVTRYEPMLRFAEYTFEPEAECVKDKNGKFVLYSTFKDEQARLMATIDRLYKQLHQLHVPDTDA